RVPLIIRAVVPTARLAPREVRHKRPPPPFWSLPSPSRVPPHLRPAATAVHLRVPPPQPLHAPLDLRVLHGYPLEFPDYPQPVTVERVLVLHVNPVRPFFIPFQKQINEGRLLVWPRGLFDPSPFRVIWASWAHSGPNVKKIHGPLTVSYQDGPCVDRDPALLLVDHIGPAMDHQIVILVLVERNLEIHIRKNGVRIDPKQPLHIRTGQHCGPDYGDLGPNGFHGRVQEGVVVEDLPPVNSAVIDFVLEKAKKKVVSVGVFARAGLGTGYEHNPVLGREIRVVLDPVTSLFVPIGHGLIHGVMGLWVVVKCIFWGGDR
ncbi:nuclear pore complex protein Nup98-Nup96, partial [Striga asiatica]